MAIAIGIGLIVFGAIIGLAVKSHAHATCPRCKQVYGPLLCTNCGTQSYVIDGSQIKCYACSDSRGTVKCSCGTVIRKFHSKGFAGSGAIFAFIGIFVLLYGLVTAGWEAFTGLFS